MTPTPPVEPGQRPAGIRALAWRITPSALRWSWLSGVAVAALHVIAAITLARLAVEADGFWRAVPGGLAMLACCLVLAAGAALWEVLGLLARRNRAGHGARSTVPIIARVFGLLAVAQWTNAAVTGNATGSSGTSGSSGASAVLVLAAFGIVALIAGVACIHSAFGSSMPIVDSEARPVQSRIARRLMRAGRASLGVLVVSLGIVCVVDVIRGGWDGPVGLGHAIDAVLLLPGGALLCGAAAVLLVLCAASALARAVATLRGGAAASGDA